jgi:hypothetical protein
MTKHKPPPIENTFDETWPPIPRCDDRDGGQIIWNVGRYEVTVTRSRREGGGFLKVEPNGHRKCNAWKIFEYDAELYYGKLHFLRLESPIQQRVWWRKRTNYEGLA